MGSCIIHRQTSTLPPDDEFEIKRKLYILKEKEFDVTVLNYYHNRDKIKKERMSRYITNEDDYEIILNELKKEITELEEIYNQQEKSTNMIDKDQKRKLLEKHKKDFNNKLKSADEVKKKMKK